MPGYFVDHATKRANLDEQHWIEHRQELLLGEWADLDVALAHAAEDGSPKAIHEGNLAFLKAYLTDWHLTDDQGKVRPFSPDAIAELREPAIAQIVGKIAEGVRSLSQAEGKALATEQEQANP
jgi:hypothetical protein